MSKRVLLIATLLLAATGGLCMTGTLDRLAANEAKAALAGVLRHVVLFKFKDDLKPEQVDEVVRAFGALPGKIDEIVEFEWGTDVSVENKAAGFTHGFVVSFSSEKGRDAYLPHPAHQEFVQLVGPRLENVLVFDFWAQK